MNDLEDFFAKKDRKKKNKKSFAKANPEIIVKNLEKQLKVPSSNTEKDEKEIEEGPQKETDTPIEQQSHAPSDASILNNNNDDDEWYDYSVLERKDYSGLKIENLNLEQFDSSHHGDNDASGGRQNNENNENENELNEDGSKRKGGKKNVWQQKNNIISSNDSDKNEDDSGNEQQQQSSSAAAAAASTSASTTTTTSSSSSSVVAGSYVPPHLRGKSTITATKGGPRRTKAAPDINSPVYFPSLSDTVKSFPEESPIGGGRRDAFEEVRGGGSQHQQKAEAPRLTLDNKFSALRGGD